MKRARQRSAAAWLLLLAAAAALQLQPVANAATTSAAITTTTPNPYLSKHNIPYEGLLVLPARESPNDKFGLTLLKAQPVIDEAEEEAVRRNLVPEGWLNLRTYDSR